MAAEGVDEAQKLPDVVEVNVYAQPESKVQRRGDFRDRIGHVIACGATAQSARCAAEKAHARVRLLVNPN